MKFNNNQQIRIVINDLSEQLTIQELKKKASNSNRRYGTVLDVLRVLESSDQVELEMELNGFQIHLALVDYSTISV